MVWPLPARNGGGGAGGSLIFAPERNCHFFSLKNSDNSTIAGPRGSIEPPSGQPCSLGARCRQTQKQRAKAPPDLRPETALALSSSRCSCYEFWRPLRWFSAMHRRSSVHFCSRSGQIFHIFKARRLYCFFVFPDLPLPGFAIGTGPMAAVF